MKFEQVCQSMNSFFQQNSIIRVLLPISVPIMFVCVTVQWLGNLISLGGVANAISQIGFFLMVFLVLSSCNFKMASVGLGIYALMYLYYILRSLLKYHSLNWGSVVYLVVYGYFTYQCYRKSLQINR